MRSLTLRSRIEAPFLRASVLNASDRVVPRLHVVTDASIIGRPDFLSTATRLLHAGPGIAFHLRDRTAPASRLAALASRLAPVALDTGAHLFINARPDIAAAVGAAGVQLGQGDLASRDARRIVGGRLLGRSIHSADEASTPDAIEADFVMLGAIFFTASHPDRAPLGLAELARTRHPRVVAIGGVDGDGARAVRNAGAWGVAVISAVWNAPDPDDAAKLLLLIAGGDRE